MSAKKVLISGSSGMLGVDLLQELNGDYEVSGLDIVNASQLTVDSFNKCDIKDKEEVVETVKRVKPDIVIHTAAWTDVDGCELDAEKAYRINSEGTRNVALACREIEAILIYISTDFVFDGTKAGPYSEEDNPSPLSVYSDSKLKGEEAVRDLLKEYFIVRTSWLYGRHGKNFVDTILSKAKTEKVLKVVNDQIGSPTYTKDMAKAIHELLKRIFSQYAIRNTQYGIYHVSNSGSVSWYDYAKEVLKLAKLPTKVVPISSQELARPARRPAMSVLDNSKYTRYTGHRMRDWKAAVRDYLTGPKN